MGNEPLTRESPDPTHPTTVNSTNLFLSLPLEFICLDTTEPTSTCVDQTLHRRIIQGDHIRIQIVKLQIRPRLNLSLD